MKGTSPKLAAIVAAGALAIGLAACGGSDEGGSTTGGSAEKIRIGVEAPLSGDLKTLGKGMLDGGRLAADRLNDKGGLLDKPVEIVPIDDGGDAKIGVPAAKKAIADGLDGVVGPYNSGVGIETLPLYEKAGLVPIRLTSDTDTEGFGFTLQPMSSQIAPVTATALTDFLSAKKVAIAYDQTEEYTTGIAAEVRKAVEAEGAQVTVFQKLKPGAKDYSALVKNLSATDPDAIYAAVYSPEGATIAKSITGASPDCLLDYGANDDGYIEDGGKAASNCDVVGVPAPSDFAGSKTYVSDFKDQFNEDPGTWSPYTYDSVNLLAQAVQETGSLDAKELTAALDKVKGFKGWTGSATLKPGSGNREPATVTVDVVKNGAFTVDAAWAKAVGAPY
jgi:ABC-type branched-subunit amino acid transport system substrate-binding protein